MKIRGCGGSGLGVEPMGGRLGIGGAPATCEGPVASGHCSSPSSSQSLREWQSSNTIHLEKGVYECISARRLFSLALELAQREKGTRVGSH